MDPGEFFNEVQMRGEPSKAVRFTRFYDLPKSSRDKLH